MTITSPASPSIISANNEAHEESTSPSAIPSIKPDFAEKTRFKTAPKSFKLNDLLKVEAKKEETQGGFSQLKEDRPYTEEALREAWNTFAETRKLQQADYYLLNQGYEHTNGKIVMPLTNPIQETMLNEFRLELTTYLREQLQNNSIQVVGELRLADEKKMIYTPRDKFEYLMNKNPLIKEMKDRLGLDPDY